MKLIHCIIVFCCLLFSVSAFSEHNEKYKILVYGDSLSAGYKIADENSFPRVLKQQLYKKGYKNIEIINGSVSGETTVSGLKRLPEVLYIVRPNAVILELGINDVFKGFSVSSIEKNLSAMINMCREKNIPVLLIGMKSPPYAEISYQKKFNQLYAQLAKRYHLVLYPFFMKGLIAVEYGIATPKIKYMLPDKIHPNEMGVRVMVNNFLPYMIKFLKQNKEKNAFIH